MLPPLAPPRLLAKPGNFIAVPSLLPNFDTMPLVWTLRANRFRTAQYHSAGVADVQFYGAGTGLLASAARDNTIALWDIYPPSAKKERK